MDFKPGYLTNAGQKMARQAINGDIKITFTKAIGSSDDHSNDDADTINALTNLSSFNEAQLNVVGPVDATRELLKIQLSNYQMTNQNYLRTVGIYASDGSNEYLYSVLVNGDPDLVPAYNGTVPETFDVNWTAYVGRSDNVNVTVSPIGMATEEELQRLITIRELNDSDDIFNLPENGHYVINGANPANNPWGNKPIWADVYKTDFNIIARDNVGGLYVKNYNKQWATVLTTDNMDGINNSINSVANSNSAATRSTADSLGRWIGSGFDSLGGSVAYLNGQNDARINEISSLSSGTNSNANATQSVASSLGTWIGSGFNSVGGSVAYLNAQNNNNVGEINSLSSATASNANAIGSVAASLGDWDRSGFDSLGGSVAYLNAQNNDRIGDVNSLASAIKYSYIKELGNDDDVLNLPENGHYVIRGTNPANNPWGKNIWADVYKTDYQTLVRDNTGNEFIRSNNDSIWRFVLTNFDKDSLSSQSQSLADSVAASLGTWDRSGFDSLGGSVAYLNTQNNDRINDVGSLSNEISSVSSAAANNISLLSNNKVQDNHDGTVNFNGQTLALRGTIDPNADLFNLPAPGIYQSLWGYQSSLKNYPSTNGASTIVALNTKDGSGKYGGKIWVYDSWGNEFQSIWGNNQFNAWETPVHQSDINAINTRINADEQSINNNQSSINNMMLLDWEYSSWGLANQNPANRPDCYYRLSDNTIQLTGSIDVQNGDYVYFLNRFIIEPNINGGFTFNGRNAVISNWSMNSLPFNNPQVYTSVRRRCMAVGIEATQTGTFKLDGCYIQLGFA